MNIPFRIKPREKKVLLIGGVIVILIAVYQLYAWYSGMRVSAGDYIESRQINLEKQFKKISEKDSIQKELAIVSSELKELEGGLLPGDKPPVAAARIQGILKEMASSVEVEITQEKALTPVDKGLYLAIPVETGFTATTEKLTKILYKIMESRYILTVSELRIIVKNVRDPSDVYATIVINGFIKKPEPGAGDKAAEKDKNAS